MSSKEMLKSPILHCQMYRSGCSWSTAQKQWQFSAKRLLEDMPMKIARRKTVLTKRRQIIPVPCAQRETAVVAGSSGEILKRTPAQPHQEFLYAMLRRNMAFVRGDLIPFLSLLEPEIRNIVVIFGFVLRALDTVEDDTSLSSDVKIPILKNFHEHIFDRDWHFSCGSSDSRFLMDRLHLVRQAFLELEESQQEVIRDVLKTMGAGLAKFIEKEIETIDDLTDYAYSAAGMLGVAALKMFHPSRLENLDAEHDFCPDSFGIFMQKVDIICDYHEDVAAIPRPRKFWPREVWGKYVNELEDLKCDENSVKAVHCLNEMVTSTLVHVEECFKYLLAWEHNPAFFRIGGLLLVKEFGILALCYNNIDFFRAEVKLRPGLIVKIFERTRTMSNVYGAIFEFCSLMKSKVDKHDPNAMETVRRLEAIEKSCINSGMLNYREFYIMRSEQWYNPALEIFREDPHRGLICLA